MLRQNSITTPSPTAIVPQLTANDLIETACNHIRRAASIAGRVENLCEIDFDDLKAISRACYQAQQSLAQLQAQLAQAGKEAA